MKANLITKKRGYMLVPISLSERGLREFASYKIKKAYLVKYISFCPRPGGKIKKDCIKVLFKGHKETQIWHKSFFNIL